MLSIERSREAKNQPPLLVRDGLSLTEAETLLDWLENNGLDTFAVEAARNGLTVSVNPRCSGAVRKLAS